MENIRVQYTNAVDGVTVLGGTNIVEQHLRADIGSVGDDEYTHVNMLAEIAIRYVEEITGRHVESKTATVDVHTLSDRLEMPFRIQTISAFSYVNESHATTTVSPIADVWNVYKTTSPSVLEQKLSWNMPTDYALDHPYPWTITFAVNGDLDILTSHTNQTSRLFIGAALMYLAHLYENREAAGFTTGRPYVMPLAFEAITKTLKRIR